VAIWLEHCATIRKEAGPIPNHVILIFIYPVLPTALWRGVDSASNRNEYQVSLLWPTGGRCVGLTTVPLSSADCLEIWEPQPTGALRVCPRQWRNCFTFNCQVEAKVNVTITDKGCYVTAW